jgi:predicted DNA-binding transcriptional regulator AlpA
MINEEFLTPQQLADRWKITRVWLYTLKSKGKVPRYRNLGSGEKARIEFPLSEVRAYEEKLYELKG